MNGASDGPPSHRRRRPEVGSPSSGGIAPARHRRVSVVVCSYTGERWSDLVAAIGSLELQTVSAYEIIVVTDHSFELLVRVGQELPGVVGAASTRARGLSGARNTGIELTRGEIIAFLDDDAAATPTWLAELAAAFDDPHVLGVSGPAIPAWPAGARPAWFPAEFDWVVGCSYVGLPATTAPVRNLMGCNMALRREVFDAIGGFREGLGRVGRTPLGCEETELCIRASRHFPDGRFLYEPRVVVEHRVAGERASWGYFRRRCYAEGRSKAHVALLVGPGRALASERSYAAATLPVGVARGMRDAVLGREPGGLARAGAIVMGLAFTTAGYVQGRLVASVRDDASASFRRSRGRPFSRSGTDVFAPTRMVEVELTEPVQPLTATDPSSGRSYTRARVLSRLGGRPVGLLDTQLNSDGLTSEQLADRLCNALGAEINRCLDGVGVDSASALSRESLRRPHLGGPSGGAPVTPVSVVIATRDRPDQLDRCLNTVLALDYPCLEVIVVDNASSSSATLELLRRRYPSVRYVRENVPGLAVAHNRALAEVGHPIVAFTDDDVRVDPGWVGALVEAFASSEDVGCVTGLILPAELETPAQAWIDRHGRFCKGFERRVFNLNAARPSDPMFPYAAGTFGSGANMAFRTDVLRELGGFDPALGAGSLARGGDDLAAFVDVLTAGYSLVYEPAALVHHSHQRDYARVRAQAYNYGVGLSAYLTRLVVRRPTLLGHFLLRAPQAAGHLLREPGAAAKADGASYPRELLWLELIGAMYGPLAYLRSWHRTV